MIIHVHTGDSTTTEAIPMLMTLYYHYIWLLYWPGHEILQEMGWEWWNNTVCCRRQWAHKKSHRPTADVAHIRIWPWSDAWRCWTNVEPENDGRMGLPKRCYISKYTGRYSTIKWTEENLSKSSNQTRSIDMWPTWRGNRRWIMDRKLWNTILYYRIVN